MPLFKSTLLLALHPMRQRNNRKLLGFIAGDPGTRNPREDSVTRKILCGGIAAIAVLAASVAFGQEVKLKADLSAAQEVPPNQSPGKGTAAITLDTATKKLSWTVNYSGLSGPATAAHIHGPAEPGKNASPAVPFQNAGVNPITGSATLTDAQVADLNDGKYYVNIHTAANPGGEIRGQITK
jgi:CHRD domain